MTIQDQLTDRPTQFDPEHPPRVAFVVDWLEDSYQSTVWEGAAEAAAEAGVSLVALLGGVLDAEHEHGQRRNKVYQLLNEHDYDGVVLMSGTLANAHGVDILDRICPQFPRKMVCNIAIQVGDSASVLIDNTQGMRRLMEHMVRRHHYRRIAFIRGPESNPEAEARFAAYRDVLDANGIPLDSRLILPGDFLHQAGTDAVKTLLDERAIPVTELDAIVAADDLMALTAMEELRRRGIRVPAQIAVAGFDDIEEARYSNPPLTSVRQPLGLQGSEAVRIVVAALSGQSTSGPQILDTMPFFRRSCGCTADDPGFLTERPKSDTRLSLEASVERRKQLILAELTRAAHGTLKTPPGDWVGELFDALLDTVSGRDDSAFRETWDIFLQKVIDRGHDVGGAHQLLTALRRQLSVCGGDAPGQLRQLEGLLHDARLLASDAIERYQAGRRLRLARRSRLLSQVSSRLSAAPGEASLSDLIAEELPLIGIKTCYVHRYTAVEGEAELLAGVEAGHAIADSSIGTRFPAADLAPADLFVSPSNYLVLPLFDERDTFGFAVIEQVDAEGYLYELVRKLLSIAVAQRRNGARDSAPAHTPK